LTNRKFCASNEKPTIADIPYVLFIHLTMKYSDYTLDNTPRFAKYMEDALKEMPEIANQVQGILDFWNQCA